MPFSKVITLSKIGIQESFLSDRFVRLKFGYQKILQHIIIITIIIEKRGRKKMESKIFVVK